MTDNQSTIAYSSYFGGSGFDIIKGIIFRDDWTVILVGFTLSTDFPVTENAFQSNKSPGDDDAFVTIFSFDNEPPVANAGEDIVVDQGEDFMLDGRGSSDNVEIIVWLWSYDIGEGKVVVTETKMVARIPEVGSYEFTLTVEDTAGNWATNTVLVRVRDSTAPVAEAGDDVTVEEGTTVTLASTGSRDNVGVMAYGWTFEYGDDTVDLEGPEARFEFERPGTYLVTLTVDDAEGNAAMDTMTVEVVPVDVFDDPTSYLILLAVIIIIVVLVLIWMRPKEE